MSRLGLLLLVLPALAWSQDNYDVYKAIFGAPVSSTQNVVVKSEATDPRLASASSELDGSSATLENVDCNNINTYPLSETVTKLISDVEAIVTDERMDEVDAPQEIVNKSIAKSKELVCAQIEMFVKTHNLKVEINCTKRPQVIPPVHLQVVKFPGLVELKQRLENQIEGYRLQLQQNPQNFTADSLLRRATKDLNCLLDRNTQDFNCRYLIEKNFSRGQGRVQVEIQDKSGQWYEFNQLPIDYFSGTPGPKTQQGDMQVPEARYRLTSVNPASNYFSAVHIDYENWADRKILGDLNPTGVNKGGDVKLHGHGGSVGCLDLGNRGSPWMSALVDLSLKRGRVPEIDIYPTDMEVDSDELGSWPGYSQYDKFWSEVKKRYWDTHGAKVRRDLKRVDEMVEEIRLEE